MNQSEKAQIAKDLVVAMLSVAAGKQSLGPNAEAYVAAAYKTIYAAVDECYRNDINKKWGN